MVIEFDAALFQVIENRQKVSFLLYLFYIDRRHDFFIDISQITDSPIYASLNDEDKKVVEEYFNRFVNDSIDVDFLISTTSTDDIFNLDEAIAYFQNPVLVILENSLNDKYFLETIANKFSRRGKKLRRHLDNNWVVIINGGGRENIENVITEKLNAIKGLPKLPKAYLRCFVIVDSDSTFQSEETSSRKLLSAFLDSLDIKYHVTIKREMENYLPDAAYYEITGNRDYIGAYMRLSPLQKDYFDIEKGFEKNLNSYSKEVQLLYADISETDMVHFRKGLKMSNFKAEFPKLFLSEKVNQENLKQRVIHQGKHPNELEVILDKISELL